MDELKEFSVQVLLTVACWLHELVWGDCSFPDLRRVDDWGFQLPHILRLLEVFCGKTEQNPWEIRRRMQDKWGDKHESCRRKYDSNRPRLIRRSSSGSFGDRLNVWIVTLNPKSLALPFRYATGGVLGVGQNVFKGVELIFIKTSCRGGIASERQSEKSSRLFIRS